MRIYDGRDSFYQWDSNQKVVHSFKVGDEVHFFNMKQSTALTVKAYQLNNEVVADVPNILLQSSNPIYVYWMNVDEFGHFTKEECTFTVKQRPRPSGYIYTETELLNYEYLDVRISELEDNADRYVTEEFVRDGYQPKGDYATEQFVRDGYQPKGDYATEQSVRDGYQPKGDYVTTPDKIQVGQTVAVKSIDENGKPTEWKATDFPEDNIYIAEYGVSTYEEIKAAVDAGKWVFMEHNERVYSLCLVNDSHIMFGSFISSSFKTAMVKTDSTWTATESVPVLSSSLIQSINSNSRNAPSSNAVMEYAQPKGDYITNPATAKPGQLLVVKSVDENGRPIEWGAEDLPEDEVEVDENVDIILPETYLHSGMENADWDTLELSLFFNIPNPLVVGQTYYVTIDGATYETVGQPNENTAWTEDGVYLSVSGHSFIYKEGGLDYDFDGRNCVYYPSEIGPPVGDGNDMIPVTISITTPIGGDAEEPTVELVATFDDGSKKTFKLYGEVVTA